MTHNVALTSGEHSKGALIQGMAGHKSFVPKTTHLLTNRQRRMTTGRGPERSNETHQCAAEPMLADAANVVS